MLTTGDLESRTNVSMGIRSPKQGAVDFAVGARKGVEAQLLSTAPNHQRFNPSGNCAIESLND
jgi:hypothetical protein